MNSRSAPSEAAGLRGPALERPPSPSAPPVLAAGSVLRGRYRLTSTLELGHAATAYRAEEIETGRTVAVKVFHEIGRNDWSRLEALHRPTPRGAARLELPSAFLAVHDCDLADDGRLFLVTELVQGPTVADLLKQVPSLAPLRALELAMWIGEALEVVLNLGLLDLPLAPGDVIVEDGDRLKLRRSDVLILRRLGLADQLATREAPERDPRYASPEELAKLPPSERSVIYRYGVLVYELLGGNPPFDGRTPADLRRQARRRPARLRDRHRALPAALDRLVARMVDPDPLARPVDLTSILNELWEASCRLRSEAPAAAVPAATSSASVAPPTSVRRSRTRPWALAGLPIVVLGGALLAGPHPVGSPTAPISVRVPTRPEVVVAPPSPADVVASPRLVLPPSSPGTSSGLISSRAPGLHLPDLPPPAAELPPAASPANSGASPPPRAGSMAPVARSTTPVERPPAPNAPAPPSQPETAVAVPPVRPSEPHPEGPRAADPGAIIEWLVHQSPRIGE